MFVAAGWIPRTGIQHHRADVLEGAPAELASEVAANPPLVRFVVSTIRIVQAGIQYERTEVVVLLSAVFAVFAHVFTYLLTTRSYPGDSRTTSLSQLGFPL